VLKAVLQETGVSPPDLEIISTDNALRSGSGSKATQAECQLEPEGVDLEVLVSDIVIHQALPTYLKKERDTSHPEAGDNLVEPRIETTEKLQRRVAAITESAISSLASTDELDGDEYDVLVDICAMCPACDSDYSVSELLQQGGRGCSSQ